MNTLQDIFNNGYRFFAKGGEPGLSANGTTPLDCVYFAGEASCVIGAHMRACGITQTDLEAENCNNVSVEELQTDHPSIWERMEIDPSVDVDDLRMLQSHHDKGAVDGGNSGVIESLKRFAALRDLTIPEI